MRPLLVFIFCILFLSPSLRAQQQNDTIRNTLLSNTFSAYTYIPAPKRAVLNLHKKSIWARINPVNYVAAGLLFVYQRVFSEQIQARCNYVVSCSEYTKLSIQKHGFVKGSLMGIDQLSCCFPGITLDYPDHKLTAERQIINNRSDD
ncbi:MAG: membrane protein insertion efficiency factor YidD [Bacteroidia bacterium]